MSSTARKAKGRQIRAWHLNRRSGSDLSDLAGKVASPLVVEVLVLSGVPEHVGGAIA